MRRLLPAVVFLLCSTVLFAEDTTTVRYRYFSLPLRYVAIKDASNFGLVFQGMQTHFDFGLQQYSPKGLMEWNVHLGFGTLFRGGMIAPSFSLKLTELSYLLRTEPHPKLKFFLGPYFLAQYDYQLYPELQSGFSFWLTSYEAGLRLMADIPLKEKQLIRIHLSNSLLGITSRPDPIGDRDPYYFSFRFTDIVSNLHHDMAFASLNRFSHTRFRAEYIFPRKRKDLGIGYAFEYASQYHEPDFKFLSHTLQFTWYRRK